MDLYTYLLAKNLDDQMASAHSFQESTRVFMATILFADEFLYNLRTFAFVVQHLFSVGRQHFMVVVELLHIIERLEYLHTEM